MTKHTLSLTLFGACLLATPLAAGGLRRDLVPAEVKWVGHFDLEGLQKTQLWQRILERKGVDLDDAMVGLEEVKEELGLDPLKDIRAVTVWSATDREDDTVALIQTTTAIDRALERFATEDEYQLIVRDGLEIHSWGDEGFAYVHPGAGDERMLLVAGNPDVLVASARVLKGEGVSLAGTPTPRVTAVPTEGSFVFFAAAEGIPGIHEIEQASQVAALAQGLVADMGEVGGELFFRVNVHTADVDSALNLGDVCDGLVALAKLAMNTDDLPPEVGSLIGALQVETRGSDVLIEFRYDVARLLEAFEELADSTSGD